MKIFFLGLLITLSSLVWAERFQDNIHSFSLDKNEKEHLLFLRSGKVVFIDHKKFLDLQLDLRPGERVEIEIDENLSLKSLKILPPLDEIHKKNGEFNPPQLLVEPTIIANYQIAKNIFSGMNRSYKSDTECTDRAHVWAYEEWKKSGLISKKVFVFFTQTYIREYRFKWWFHVSPYTLVSEHGGIIEHVMDRRFTSYPYHMKDWTDIFVKSKQLCAETTYAYYRANNYGPEHCFIVKADMYYRLPYHVRMKEDNGIIKTRFSTSEVDFSYRAFNERGVK